MPELYLRLVDPLELTTITLDTLPTDGVTYEPPRLSVGAIESRWDGAVIIAKRDVPSEQREHGRLLTLQSTQSGTRIEGALTTAQKGELETFLEDNPLFKVQTNLLDPPLDDTFMLVPNTFVTFVSVVPSREYWAWVLNAVRVVV